MASVTVKGVAVGATVGVAVGASVGAWVGGMVGETVGVTLAHADRLRINVRKTIVRIFVRFIDLSLKMAYF
jgi:phage tail tape-measure protein